jgi:basic membrane protein A and related proteins
VVSRRWLLSLATSTSILLSLISPISPAYSAPSVKIAIAYDVGGRGDKAENDAVGIGVDLAKKNLKLTQLDVREMVTDGSERDRSRRLRFLASAGYSTIIAVGSGYEKSVSTVSLEFPDTSFAIIDNGNVSNLNVESLIFDTQQGSYLAGVLAASASKSNKVGFLGDVTIPTTPNQAVAFSQGAKHIKPKITVSIDFPKANTPASAITAMHKAGVDVLYSNWIQSSEPLEAVISLNSKKSPLKLIGVLPDQYWLQSARSKGVLIGAFTKHLESAAYDAIFYAIKDLVLADVLSTNPNIYGKLYTVKDAGIGMALTGEGQSYSAVIKSVSSLLKAGKIKVDSL